MKQQYISDFCSYTMGQSPASQFYNKTGEGLPFLQGCTTFGRMFPTFDTWTTSYTRTCKPGEVLMSVRAPVGDLNISQSVIALGRGVASFSMNNGNNHYLYYLLQANRQLLISTLRAAKEYSDYDIAPFIEAMKEKLKWCIETYPDDVCIEDWKKRDVDALFAETGFYRPKEDK